MAGKTQPPARAAIRPAIETAATVNRSGAPYGLIFSNSNSAVGELDRRQFGHANRLDPTYPGADLRVPYVHPLLRIFGPRVYSMTQPIW